jgi:hypothetical protein
MRLIRIVVVNSSNRWCRFARIGPMPFGLCHRGNRLAVVAEDRRLHAGALEAVVAPRVDGQLEHSIRQSIALEK